MYAMITDLGALTVDVSGTRMAGLAKYSENGNLHWYPDFIYTGSSYGGLMSNYHDYDSSLPNYVCRLVEGKYPSFVDAPYDILLRLNENDRLNEIVSRRKTTKDRFLKWFKSKIGSTDEIKRLVIDLITWEPALKRENFDLVLKNGGFPYVYVDLKEWVDKCR